MIYPRGLFSVAKNSKEINAEFRYKKTTKKKSAKQNTG